MPLVIDEGTDRRAQPLAALLRIEKIEAVRGAAPQRAAALRYVSRERSRATPAEDGSCGRTG